MPIELRCVAMKAKATIGVRSNRKALPKEQRARAPRIVQVRAIRTQDTDDAEPSTQDRANANPSLRDAPEMGGKTGTRVEWTSVPENSFVVQRAMRTAYRRILLELSSLPRSMAVLFTISVLSALGTVIEQGKSFQFYVDSYPDGKSKMFGFLTYKIILFLQLDHIYTAPYFYGLLGLLVAQLIACTHTRQWPIAKVAKRWRFAKTPNGIALKENAEVLPDGNIKDLGVVLSKRGYEVFLKNGSLYGFKSLVARLAPIGVHAALLVTIAGIMWGVLGGFKGTVMIPEGRAIEVQQHIRPNSFFAVPPSGAFRSLRLEDFTIDYRSDGGINQFYSDLSVLDGSGSNRVIDKRRISVNHPLRFEGITMYQTDWGMSSLAVTVESSFFPEGKRSVRFPMATLKSRQNKNDKVFATFIPTPGAAQDDSSVPKGISVLANDFQSVILYDSAGQFAGVRRPGSGTPIEVSDMKLTIDDIGGSTGLEIKYDPGVPLVYTGFAFLMITTFLSYQSHAQVWALQVGRDLHVAGKSHRAGVLFEKEFSDILDAVPDSGIHPSEEI